MKEYTTREILEELKERGQGEQYYNVIGTEMALGAQELINRLPGSMLDYKPADQEIYLHKKRGLKYDPDS